MDFFDRHPVLRRAIALVSAVAVTACTTWRVETGKPDALIAGQPDVVRVVLVRGDTLILRRPAMAGDTVTGFAREGDYSRTRILLRDVKAVETQHATEKGLLISVVVVAGVIVAAVAIGRLNFENLSYVF